MSSNNHLEAQCRTTCCQGLSASYVHTFQSVPLLSRSTCCKYRVVYHGVTSSFFGIGILPVSDLSGQSVFWSVLLVWRELLFTAKGGLAVSIRGLVPHFSFKKGASAPFLREKGVPAKKMIPKCTDRDFLRYRYGKYQEIPTNTDWKIPIRYTTLCK
jgi:hypothetical protein